MPKLKKKKESIQNRLDYKISGDVEELNKKDKLNFIKKEYKLAKKVGPAYKKLKNEVSGYTVELPQNPDVKDLSKINELYAITQSFHSRTTAIEMIAIDNHSRWKRLCNLMEGYLEDRESALLISEEITEDENIRNMNQQQAKVHTLLKNVHVTLRKLKDKLSEAEGFKRIVEIKKKDLSLVLTTLGKQVKALSVEQSLMH